HELIESLVERGVLAPAASDATRLVWARRDEALSVPTTVEAVVAARLDRLPADEQEALRRAAVLGRVFRVDDVAALLAEPGAPPVDPSAALAQLCTRGILEPGPHPGQATPGEYSFRNLLTK